MGGKDLCASLAVRVLGVLGEGDDGLRCLCG